MVAAVAVPRERDSSVPPCSSTRRRRVPACRRRDASWPAPPRCVAAARPASRALRTPRARRRLRGPPTVPGSMSPSPAASARWKASFDPGAMIRWMIIASIRSRTRRSTCVRPCSVRSSPSLRIMPRTAAHVAVRQAANDLEAGLVLARFRARHFAAIEQRRDAVDQRLRQLRQIGQRALLDAPALAIALAQKNRRRRRPVGDGVDEHVRAGITVRGRLARGLHGHDVA